LKLPLELNDDLIFFQRTPVPCCTRCLLHHGVRDALEMMTSTGLSELNMMQLRTLVLFDYDKVVHQFDDEV
jgi:hypothetical protein